MPSFTAIMNQIRFQLRLRRGSSQRFSGLRSWILLEGKERRTGKGEKG